MTSQEIAEMQAIDLSTNAWLREMCFQLALFREKIGVTAQADDVQPTTVVHEDVAPIRRKPGRPKKVIQ